MGRTVTLLVVDDEAWVRSLVKDMVDWDRVGVSPAAEAATAAEALELCRKKAPDILLTDIRMPGMDGLELIARAREIAGELEAIVVSGYDEFSYARQALREGALDYLLKPIGKAALEAALEKAADAVRRRRAERDRLKAESDKAKKLEAALIGRSLGAQPAGAEKAVGDPRILRVRDYLLAHCDENPTLERAAEIACMNRTYFSETFKRELGQGYGEFLRGLRLERAKTLLETSDLCVKAAAAAAGFPDPVYFARAFRSRYGAAPGDLRRGQKLSAGDCGTDPAAE